MAHGEREAAVNQRYEKSRQYVGIDLHRRRSVIVRMDGEGEVLDCVRIENSVPVLVEQVARAGSGAPVAVEATYGWYWAVDALTEAGFEVTLAHPRGVASMQGRRAKTDKLDATELADLLRLGRLATAWIAPPEIRELRELVRYRHKLVHDRAAVKASIHAVLGKCGVIPEISDIFGPVGSKMLDALVLPEPYASRVASQRRIMATLSTEIAGLEVETVRRLKDDPEYRALLTINGVGPVMAAIFVAEIGDVHRFATADQLACWDRAHDAGGLLGQEDPLRARVQAGLEVVAVGRGRGLPTSPRALPGRQAPRHHRPARQARPAHRDGGGGPADDQGRLLHDARRARPMPGRTPAGHGVNRPLTRRAREVAIGMARPSLAAVDFM